MGLILQVSYLFGGIQYFSGVDNPSVGGWSFTFGSMCFLVSSMVSWISNYTDNSRQSWISGERAEISVIHSVLFLAGSIGFIPALNIAIVGVWVFIVASIWVSIAEFRRLYRIVSRNGIDSVVTSGCETNQCHNGVSSAVTPVAATITPCAAVITGKDWESIWAAAFAAGGGLSYIAGSVLFLPEIDCDADLAAAIFTVGGASFCLSALAPLSVLCCRLRAKPDGEKRSSGDTHGFLTSLIHSSCQHTP